MDYFELYQEGRENFSLTKDEMEINSINVKVKLMSFSSPDSNQTYESYMLPVLRQHYGIETNDNAISENKTFKYPVFLPDNKASRGDVIILLHGLNERNWEKYLPWASYLSANTKKAIIAFPISFHMNRAPGAWSKRQEMSVLSNQRKEQYRETLQASTFANYAISSRLTESPERFLLSGLQTINDLLYLFSQIKSGTHPLFARNANIDFFSYSIGGFLSQVMMLSNPMKQMESSKHFLFCSGCLFEDMNGISKAILDNQASLRLKQFYMKEMPASCKKPGVVRDFFYSSKIGNAFKAMLSLHSLRNFRRTMFGALQHQVFIQSLKEDVVMPYQKIARSVGNSFQRNPKRMSVSDFTYPYSHEVPFPVLNKHVRSEVDTAFKTVFDRAVHFLT